MSLRSLSLVMLLPVSASLLVAAPLEGLVLPWRQVEVSAPVSCRIVEMKVKEGDQVKAGQALAVLDGRLEELEMQRAKALLERSEFEAKGAKRLYENRIIPESKALETRIDLELARLRYETAVEQVRLRTILAPLDGVVVLRSHDVGETVSTTQPLFRILDLSRVRVQVAVAPKLLSQLPVGRKVGIHFHQALDPDTADGEVSLVDPCADASGQVRIQVTVPNPEGRIRSGLRAEVTLGPVPQP